MEINGKEAKFKLDMGAIKIMKKQHGVNMFSLDDEGIKDPEVLTAIIHACAVRGGSKITMEDVDSMDMPALIAAQGEIEKMMADFMPEGTGDHVPLPVQQGKGSKKK